MSYQNFGPWKKEPFNQDAVIKWFEANPGEHTMAEVEAGVGITKACANNCLKRLVERGVLTMRMVPWTQTMRHHRTGAMFTVPRKVASYSLAANE